MLISTFLCTLLKYMLVDVLWCIVLFTAVFVVRDSFVFNPFVFDLYLFLLPRDQNICHSEKPY